MNWIKSSEKLPPESTPMEIRRVLVFVPDLLRMAGENGIRFGWRMAGEWRVDGSPSNWNVTYWMPVPKPPGRNKK